MSLQTNKIQKLLVLFDVDGTLTPARLTISEEMKTLENYVKSCYWICWWF